jgi:hypothetical protein
MMKEIVEETLRLATRELDRRAVQPDRIPVDDRQLIEQVVVHDAVRLGATTQSMSSDESFARSTAAVPAAASAPIAWPVTSLFDSVKRIRSVLPVRPQDVSAEVGDGVVVLHPIARRDAGPRRELGSGPRTAREETGGPEDPNRDHVM